MYPFESRWKWYLGNRHVHLIEATRDHLEAFQQPYQDVLVHRAERMETALKARLFFIVLLNLSLISTALTWLAQYIALVGEVQDIVASVRSYVTGLTVVLAGIVFLIMRYLGQLEADMVSAMALGTPGTKTPSPDEFEKVKELEADEARRHREAGSTPG